MLDRREIMVGAWNMARYRSLKSGKPARTHLVDALREAWAVARNLAAKPQAPVVHIRDFPDVELSLSNVPASMVARLVAAHPQAVRHVSARGVTLAGRSDLRDAFGRIAREVEAMTREAIAANPESAPVRYASKAEIHREAVKAAREARAARAAAREEHPTWVDRIVVGSYEVAPATQECGDRVLTLTGYGKIWSNYNPEDCSAYGVHPMYECVRYAYYA